ncbi:hypothetical protein THAOC_21837, partial [Thalassiosira oceanica]
WHERPPRQPPLPRPDQRQSEGVPVGPQERQAEHLAIDSPDHPRDERAVPEEGRQARALVRYRRRRRPGEDEPGAEAEGPGDEEDTDGGRAETDTGGAGGAAALTQGFFLVGREISTHQFRISALFLVL